MSAQVTDAQFAKRLLLTLAAQGVMLGAALCLAQRLLNETNRQDTYRRKVAGKDCKLNTSEFALLDCVCDAAALDVTFESVGGLAHVKEIVRRSVVLPFQHPEMYPANSLRSPPKGVLLYGPPGTGKTLVAKAIAKSCGAAFIEVKVESLFGKWLGQSEQAVAAIFSLARKLEPCIIFVDEIDSLLSRRDSGDNHAYTNAKTIFLRQWDGFGTDDTRHRVVIVGATNRPNVLDSAVLRRMPVKLRLDLPREEDREAILGIILGGEDCSSVNLNTLAHCTGGYSGSDLRELCKQVLLLVVEEALVDAVPGGPLNPQAAILTTERFLDAMSVVGANRDVAARFSQEADPLDSFRSMP